MFSQENQKSSPLFSLESLILAHIREQFPTKGVLQGKIKGNMTLSEARFYAKGLRALSDHFNGIQKLAARNYLALKPYRAAYLLYFFPANWAKMQAILAEIQHTLPQKANYHICDVGSGAGALSLAAVDYLSRGARIPRFSVDLFDQSPAILGDAARLGKKGWGGRVRSLALTTVSTSILSPRGLPLGQSRYDLIFLGDFLNEIDEEQHFKLAERLIGHHLAENGRLILLEPALQSTSRALQRLRDLIVTRIPMAKVLAPCLRQGLCPLNFYNKRDWCHFYADWERPSWFPLLEKEAGLHKDWLKYSYLVIGRQENTQKSSTPEHSSLWRVVSNPMRSKGKQESVLCGPQGRIHLMAQYKDKSLKNKDFFEIHRGDRVRLQVKDWWVLAEKKESWDHRLVLGPHQRITIEGRS